MRMLISFLLICASLTILGVGAHGEDYCEGGNCVERITPASNASGNVPPADCACPVHHGCFHSPLFLARTASAVVSMDLRDSAYPAPATSVLPAPDLEGPFQPPKA